jgi:branched-chain amino acid transport system permease protein
VVSLIAQLLIDGTCAGLLYVILAGGLVLIQSVSGIFFIAYGQFFMIAAYVTYGLIVILHAPFIVALAVAVIVTALLGVASYVLVFRNIRLSERQFLSAIVIAMGLMLVLGQSGLILFGTSNRSVPSVFNGMLEFGDVIVPFEKVMIMSATIVVVLLLFFMYHKTSIGRAMRAVACQPDAAVVSGISIKRVYLITMGIAGALAGFAGAIIAPSYGINPSMGNNALLTVLLVSMLGGMDSLAGTVVGGLVFGILLSFGQFYFPEVAQILLYSAIGIIIFLRPQGLLGRRTNVEV